MKKIFFILFGLGLIFCACTKPPTEEMNRAIETLNRAENDVNALLYAPNYLARARESLLLMQEDADSKRYDSAKIHAAEVVSYAERAVREGNTAAAQAGNEANDLLNSLTMSIRETDSNIKTAKDLPNILLDFNSLDGMLESAKGTYENAQQSLSAENYPDVINQGQAVRSILSDINTQISQAAFATFQKK